MDPLLPGEDYLMLYNEHNDKGWGHFFDKFHPDLAAYAASLLKNTIENENIASQALIDTWPPSIEFDSEDKLKGYLLSVVHNKCIDYKKERGLYVPHPDDIQEGPLYDEPAFARKEAKCQEIMNAIEKRKGLSRDVGREILLGGKKNQQFARERGLLLGYVAKVRYRLILWIKGKVKF